MPGGEINVDPANGVLVVQVRYFVAVPAEIPAAPPLLTSGGRRGAWLVQPETRDADAPAEPLTSHQQGYGGTGGLPSRKNTVIRLKYATFIAKSAVICACLAGRGPRSQLRHP